MTTTSTARRSTKPTKLPAALRIPVAVLAQMPEKLRLLGETLRAASKTIKGSDEDFSQAYDKVSHAFVDANDTANCIVEAFAQLGELATEDLSCVVKAANAAHNLTSAIYKVCGNIYSDDCFKNTFDDEATVKATIAALSDCSGEIRAMVRRYSY
jgi:hypothetical protein